VRTKLFTYANIKVSYLCETCQVRNC